MKDYYVFPDSKTTPELSEVGGKALSLCRTAQKFPVPPGTTLTTDFFAEWVEQIKASNEWKKLLDKFSESTAKKLYSIGKKLVFSDRQLAIIDEIKKLEIFEDAESFAVRSSSPAEDLEQASFAGEYESSLGVSKEKLAEVIHQIFLSALNPRVFSYKIQQKISIENLAIAVIVQKQIYAQAAGVAFSQNPLNNDLDEVLVNANPGLGEAVVSGLCTPDAYVVNKITHKIISRTAGKREKIVDLGRELNRLDQEFCLSNQEIIKISTMTSKVEKFYGLQIDIEWAVTKDNLYLLQARPVTANVPLDKKLITEPGEQKKLYFDMTLGVQGMDFPVSVLGLDWLKRVLGSVGKELLGFNLFEGKNANMYADGGRAYVDIDRLTSQMGGVQEWFNLLRLMDRSAVDIVNSNDISEYLIHKPWRIKLQRRVMLRHPALFFRLLLYALFPKFFAGRYKKRYVKALLNCERLNSISSFNELWEESLKIFQVFRMENTMVVVAPAIIAQKRLHKYVEDLSNGRSLVEKISSALPNNVTVKMGLGLAKIAEEVKKQGDNAEVVFKESPSHDLRELLADYTNKYGCRGAGELDLASKRFGDDESLILSQVQTLLDSGADSLKMYRERQVEREKAYKELLDLYVGHPFKRMMIKHWYKVILTLGGFRENHKYYLIKCGYAVRRRLLEIGERFYHEKRIDTVDDIFKLSYDELSRSLADPGYDLKKDIEQNSKYYRKLANVATFPHIIDSRCRIFKRNISKDNKSKPGCYAGEGVSPGCIKGKVKVLHDPYEKKLGNGEILVARATDPGWTPLFINAGAVLLEVGGALQHGALVAREYGKPCIVGLDGITKKLRDGMFIEVDADTGIVEILPAVSS